MGYNMPDRTVCFHLLYLDKMGFTVYMPKKGRHITDKGVAELSSARIIEKVGFLAAKIDRMTYRMSFDLKNLNGSVVINLSIVKKQNLENAGLFIKRVFDAHFAKYPLVKALSAL